MNDSRKIQELINDFAKIQRNHYLPGSDNREGDLHHSFSVAMLAWMLYGQLHLDLDLSKILRYALAHDLVEVYAGDVNSYASDEARHAKEIEEARSLERLDEELSPIAPDLISVMKAYEQKADPEVNFVWIVDKIQALVQAKEDHYRAFYEQGLSRSDVMRVHGSHVDRLNSPVREYYAALLDEFLAGYDDHMAHKNGHVIEKNQSARA